MAQFREINDALASLIDQTTNPPWCMVPAFGAKVVRLEQGDGLSLRIAPGATTSIQFTESKGVDGQRIKIEVQGPGEATLQAVKDQMVMASLDISVFPRKDFKIAIRFVYDKGGEITGRSLSKWSFDQERVKQQVDAMNRVYLPQVNLGVTLMGMGPTHVSDDLSQGFIFRAGGISPDELKSLPENLQLKRSDRFPAVLGCVSGKPPGPLGCDPAELQTVSNPDLRRRLQGLDEEYNLFGRTDPGADFTFLLINKLQNAPDVGAFTKADGCILPDAVPEFARVFIMAHEFGHFLLGRRRDDKGKVVAWHTGLKDELMYPVLASLPTNLGFRIRKTEALQMAKKNPG